jgi:hypothetical protein
MSNEPQSEIRVEKFFEDINKLYVHAEWNVWQKGLANLTSILLESKLEFDHLQRFFEFRRIPQQGVNGTMGSTVEFIENNSQIIDQILKYLEDKTKNNYSLNQTRFIDLLSNINYQKYGIEESQQSSVMNSIMNVLNDVDTRPLWKLWIWRSILEIRGIDNLQEINLISELCVEHKDSTIMNKLIHCIGESKNTDYLDLLFNLNTQAFGYEENEKISISLVEAIGQIGGERARNYLINAFDEEKNPPGKGVYARCLAEMKDEYVIDYFVKLATESEHPGWYTEHLAKINSKLSNEILRVFMGKKRKKDSRKRLAAAIALMGNSDLEAIRTVISFANKSKSGKDTYTVIRARDAIIYNQNPKTLHILLQEQETIFGDFSRELGKRADEELNNYYWQREYASGYKIRFIEPMGAEGVKPTLGGMLGHADSVAVQTACHHIGEERIQGFADKLWDLSTHPNKFISFEASIGLIKFGEDEIVEFIRKGIIDGTTECHISVIKTLAVAKKASSLNELILLSKLYINSDVAMELILNCWVEMDIDNPDHVHSIDDVLQKWSGTYNRRPYKYWTEMEKLANFAIEKIVKKRKNLTFDNFETEKKIEDNEAAQIAGKERNKKSSEEKHQRLKNFDTHGLKIIDSERDNILAVLDGDPKTISKEDLVSLSNKLIEQILNSNHADKFKEIFGELKKRDDIWPRLLRRIELRINNHPHD